jgi:hypothetical protein
MKNKDLFICSILCLTIISFSHNIFGQRPKYGTTAMGLTELMEALYDPLNSPVNMLRYSDIKGTPYLHSEFQEGELLTLDSVLYKGIFFRYDIYGDAIEFKSNGNELVIGNTTNINYIQIQDDVFHRINYFNKNKLKGGYFKLLVDGSCNLYAKYSVDFYNKKEPAAYSRAEPARFGDIKCNYYINFKTDSKPILIKNKKQLLTLLARKETEMASFFKQYKIKVSKEDDLVQLIEFYNSL